MKKISIIIPVYNEKETILRILEKLEEVNFQAINFEKEVVIIDDGSTDGTRENLKNLESKYRIFYNEKNLGKGGAIHRGIRKATGDWIIIQDADLEYEPQDIPELLKLGEEKEVQVVYGSRTLKKDNKKRKYSGLVFAAGGIFVTWVCNLLYQTRITDEPTCYKLFKADFLKSIKLEGKGFEFCPEVTAKVAKRGVKIYESPISYYPRHKAEGKKINWRDGAKAIWTLIKYKFKD
jgi:glycosyltransferase involved in cell wall biosynthesis